MDTELLMKLGDRAVYISSWTTLVRVLSLSFPDLKRKIGGDTKVARKKKPPLPPFPQLRPRETSISSLTWGRLDLLDRG